jgi:hypothetical protein
VAEHLVDLLDVVGDPLRLASKLLGPLDRLLQAAEATNKADSPGCAPD